MLVQYVSLTDPGSGSGEVLFKVKDGSLEIEFKAEDGNKKLSSKFRIYLRG